MDEISNISARYHRPLQPQSVWGPVIPQPRNGRLYGGKGDTSLSTRLMAKAAIENQEEARELARILRGRNLEETIRNIKTFIYPNFQYRADGKLQKIRTLAYAFWKDRKTGIDCKSYSTIASQILLQLGLKHYFRKISQKSTPDRWSHVYVIVPRDQQTGRVTNPGSYFVIDGVPEYSQEPAFIQYQDIPVTMEHEILNGPQGLGINFSKTFGDFCNREKPKGGTGTPTEVKIVKGDQPRVVGEKDIPTVTAGGKIQPVKFLVINVATDPRPVLVEKTKENCRNLIGLGCPHPGLGSGEGIDWSKIGQAAQNLFSKINFKFDADQAFKDLFQRALTENWYKLPGTNLGAADLGAMNAVQLNTYINESLPSQIRAVESQSGYSRDRVKQRYVQVIKTIRDMATARLAELQNPNDYSSGGSENPNSGNQENNNNTPTPGTTQAGIFGFSITGNTVFDVLLLGGLTWGAIQAWKTSDPDKNKKKAPVRRATSARRKPATAK